MTNLACAMQRLKTANVNSLPAAAGTKAALAKFPQKVIEGLTKQFDAPQLSKKQQTFMLVAAPRQGRRVVVARQISKIAETLLAEPGCRRVTKNV